MPKKEAGIENTQYKPSEENKLLKKAAITLSISLVIIIILYKRRK